MTDPQPEMTGTPADRILPALGLMATAMLILPLRDGLAKHMTATLPVVTVAWGTYVAAALVAVPIALHLHGRSALVPAGLPSQTARTLLLVAAMTIFFEALRTVPLADAIAAYFIAPFAAAALAPLVLKERLSLRIALAVSGGFIGVLFVLRPAGGFDPGLLWAVAAGLLFALYMLATRLAARQAPPLASLSYQSLLGALVLTPLALAAGIQGISTFLWLFALVGILQGTSHGLSIAAFRLAPASVLAPLVYLEIVGAVIIGLALFGDWPEPAVWAGIAIIVTAGLAMAVRRN